MKRIAFFLLFIVGITTLKAQDVSELEKANGYFDIHFKKTKGDFKELQPVENSNPEWYRFKSSPKRKTFINWATEGEYGRFSNDTIRDICINFLSSESDAACKELIQQCETKYGKTYKRIETPTASIYIWQAPTITFTINIVRDAAEKDKFVIKVVYSTI